MVMPLMSNVEAHMKYVLLIYLDDLAWSETEREACYVESTQLVQQIHTSGAVSGR